MNQLVPKSMTPYLLRSGPLVDSSNAEIDQAVEAAAAASADWAMSSCSVRAKLLRSLADALENDRETLLPIADRETSLGAARLSGEILRTSFQLRGFAEKVESGSPFEVIDDPAIAAPPPAGRPHLMRVRVPLGPVAMFSASNFPFAFSVLGGDTASALAAGCPVIIKAHPGHPELSRRVFWLAARVISELNLPSGILTMIEGAGIDVGVRLVRHPKIAAVAFTGSFKGGVALNAEAASRPRPIPFYGELGSINPVIVLPAALAASSDSLAKALAASIAMGSGQFCTSPGVVIVIESPASSEFVRSFTNELGRQQTHGMLTPAIRSNFSAAASRIASRPGVQTLLDSQSSVDVPTPIVLETDASAFVADHALREEVFGPFCVVVKAESSAQVVEVLESIGGSLTTTLWGAEQASEDVRSLIAAATRIAGRVLFQGVPTGVAVTAAQQHGGPWPASTQPATTSVGYAAIDRFLRPVALQDPPPWLNDYWQL